MQKEMLPVGFYIACLSPSPIFSEEAEGVAISTKQGHQKAAVASLSKVCCRFRHVRGSVGFV